MSTRKEVTEQISEDEKLEQTANDRALAFAANLGEVIAATEKQGDDIKRHAIGALRDVVVMGG